MATDDRRVGRARAKSFDRKRGPLVGLAGYGFLLGGAALAAVGIATSLQPSLHPRLADAAWVLGRLGLGGEHLLLVGVALSSAGVVLLALQSFARLLGVDRETAEAIEDLARATTNQAECIEGLETLVAALRQETAEVHVVLRDQAVLLKRREENDPAFRIAASLDQVGARLDRGISDARDQLLDELHQLGGRAHGSTDGPLLDGMDRIEGTLGELTTLTLRFQQALDAAVQPMAPEAQAEPPEAAHVTPSWSDLEPRVSLERFTHSHEGEPTNRDEPRWSKSELERWDGDSETTELSIEVELDRAFVDSSDDDRVPAPLPAARPEGLDLLARLDSAHPLEIESRLDTPPLFPDLEGRKRG